MLTPYRVQAYNSAKASENKIHDDATAQRFGFKGGFVSGVNVYAYMAHMPVARWGLEWLERGTGEARFAKPVYENDIAEVTAVEDADGMELQVTSLGILCTTGRASLPAAAATVSLADYKLVPPRTDRQPASEKTLAVGDWLGMSPLQVTAAIQQEGVEDVRETDPLYAREGLVHPGQILRACNWVLTHNVVLPAWIHTGSVVQNLGVARIGQTLDVRARVTRNWEHKGHKWIELDALVIADGIRPIARVTHSAIYRPKQMAEAA
jgi:acyl dehydratase